MRKPMARCGQSDELKSVEVEYRAINTPPRKHIFIDQLAQDGRFDNVIGGKTEKWGYLCNSSVDFPEEGVIQSERDRETGGIGIHMGVVVYQSTFYLPSRAFFQVSIAENLMKSP